MHADPPVYHRDIRAPNIIRTLDGTGWFLIDWSDASEAPTSRVTHMTESEHSPRVREDNHGQEVDIWGIARYMEELAFRVPYESATSDIANPEAVRQMARRWMGDISMTATRALEEIQVSQHILSDHKG
jgi:hypothetical protein